MGDGAAAGLTHGPAPVFGLAPAQWRVPLATGAGPNFRIAQR